MKVKYKNGTKLINVVNAESLPGLDEHLSKNVKINANKQKHDFYLEGGGVNKVEKTKIYFFSACFFDGLIEEREPVSKPVRKHIQSI